MIVIDLGRGTLFRVFHDTGYVETVFPDGWRVGATRERTAANVQEARAQGYLGDDCCWRSLVEHEILHTLVARQVFGSESVVLRHEAGAERAPHGRRLLEEGVVISLQHFLNWQMVEPMLGGMGLIGVAYDARRLAAPVLDRPPASCDCCANGDTP